MEPPIKKQRLRDVEHRLNELVLDIRGRLDEEHPIRQYCELVLKLHSVTGMGNKDRVSILEFFVFKLRGMVSGDCNWSCGVGWKPTESNGELRDVIVTRVNNIRRQKEVEYVQEMCVEVQLCIDRFTK